MPKYNGVEVEVVFTFPAKADDLFGYGMAGLCTIEHREGWKGNLAHPLEAHILQGNRKYKYVRVNELTK